jgi:PAS domain S-box-containing protein
MSPIFSLITQGGYLNSLTDPLTWASLLGLLGVLFALLWRTRIFNNFASPQERALLVGLIIAAPFASLLFGLRLPPGSALPPPDLAVDPNGPAAMLFSALPWVVAGGMLGPAAAAGVALLSGLMLGFFETHSWFTAMQLALLAALFSLAVRQRFRTPVFQAIRSPIVAGALTVLVFAFIDFIIRPLSVSGELASRIDYTQTNLLVNTLAFGIEMLVAGLVAQALSLWMPRRWGPRGYLIPSPSERSLRARFLLSLAPLAISFVIVMMVSAWWAAGTAARDLLAGRMKSAASLAAEGIPYYLETGQQLISQIAQNQDLLSSDPELQRQALVSGIRRAPFFSQLTLLDIENNVQVSYPTEYFVGPQAPIEEFTGVSIAVRSGIPYQIFSIPPAAEQTTAQTSFVAAVFDQNQVVRAVLVGRSDLAINPFTRPIIQSLQSMANDEGLGILLDDDQRILVHPDQTLIMSTYTGDLTIQSRMFESVAPDGSRLLVYHQQASGRPWTIVLAMPARTIQKYALQIAAPLLLMILVLAVIGFVVTRIVMRSITNSLQKLTLEASSLAQGKLDQPLAVYGEDEVGQLGQTFEKMRQSLKARLDELNRLLLVSQGVASNLEISEAVQPVLESALASGAVVARVVLTPSVIPELDGDASTPISFGAGAVPQLYSELDEQILALTRQQNRLVQNNTNRPRLLSFVPGTRRPHALLALALRNEKLFYGALWVGYDQIHNFTEEEVRFLSTLASQAALAASNTRLFLNAEVGRQRLAAILASSPDPVLVTDQRNRLLLANPAAWQALGVELSDIEGQPMGQIITQNDLLDLMQASNTEKMTREVSLADGRVYLATATSVLAEGQRVGRVCVMRDVTYFKELDGLKSDFVSTVSHDLRAPLTLMRGYATMLEMVGQLNEQQVGYVRKIIEGVENMSHLVNNLLDLGRIEAGVDLQLEMIPVHDLVEQVVGNLQLPAAQKHITLTYDIPKQTVPLIEADQSLLRQALQNLIENAIKYTRTNGKVHVRVSVRQNGMVFEVNDNGIGISPMDLPRLFEKFYRGAQQTTREQRGTGLGLAIVKSIAERHGGQVSAESQLGKGSSFYLSIPLRQASRIEVV